MQLTNHPLEPASKASSLNQQWVSATSFRFSDKFMLA